jgi:outer membrane protein assembly factor BamB
MRRLAAAGLVLLAAGCSGGSHTQAAAPRPTHAAPSAAPKRSALPLGLPRVRSRLLPGYLLIADRNNNRILIVSPGKRVVWSVTGLRGPDDAFFTPGYRSVITNEEFNDTLTEVSLATKRPVWTYGHAGVAGGSAGYLNTPDDAYRLQSGITTVADIRNCRIVQISRAKRVVRVLGGSCTHDPPRGFASPNGDTPLPDGGLLVTEIGGWIDRLDARGRLVWSVRSPVAYPSDAQLLPNGRILVSSFTDPGRIVELTISGRVTWSFGALSGENRLRKPSLAVRLPNGLIAANDDYNHRVILIDPASKRIVWQYGHTGVSGSGPGYLSKPDGMDLLPAAAAAVKAAPVRAPAALRVERIGSLPAPTARLAAVALPDGRVLALGGIAGGTSSAQVLLGPPERLRVVGQLPVPVHDAAAALRGGAAFLYGGGQAVSTPAIVRIDPARGAARAAGRLDEPLSDLGAVTLGGHVYLVGGYTGSLYAAAVLRVGAGGHTTTVARLPAGLRYAGVAALGGRIYVAGGIAPSGTSAAVYRVDPAAGRVELIGTLPAPVAHAPLVAVGGALYLVGGDGSAAILRIDPESGAVTHAATLPAPLAGAAAVAVGDRGVVLGGEGSAAVYAFSPGR